MPGSDQSCTRISVFNHKGGVGKTTLTVNLAAALAKRGRRVLLVDSDPQCNLTSYMVDEQTVDALLDKADTPQGKTIWSAVEPVAEGVGPLRQVPLIETAVSNIYLLPGDIRLSEYEVDLAEFWGQCLQRRPRGFRGTAAVSELVDLATTERAFDYVFFDSGPNIGPLNRAIVLGCDYFIVPVACDLFSLRALKTLGRTLASWIADWRGIADLAPEGTPLLPGRPRFLGYVPVGFRVYGGAIASQQSQFLSRIDTAVYTDLIAVLRNLDQALAPASWSRAKLAEVKNFGALAPASQKGGRPFWEAGAGTGEQREEAARVFERLATQVEARAGRGRAGR